MRRVAAVGAVLGVLWGAAGAAAQAGATAAPPSDAAAPASAPPPPSAAGAPVLPTPVDAPPPPSAAEPPALDSAPAPPPAPNHAPDGNPYLNARGRRQRWTQADVTRIRAALAAQRAELARRAAASGEPQAIQRPRVYGDAGASVMIGFEISALFRHDVGFDHFDGGKVSTRFGLFASYDLVSLAPKLILSAELGAGLESDQAPGLLGSSTHADLDSQTLHAGVDLRWDALPMLSPMLRAWGGASLFQLALSDAQQALETDHAVSGFGALGGGILLHTPPRTFESRGGQFASFGLGLLVEGGYALRSAIDFSLHSPADAHRIAVVDAQLGRLTLSGPYIRTALVVRF